MPERFIVPLGGDRDEFGEGVGNVDPIWFAGMAECAMNFGFNIGMTKSGSQELYYAKPVIQMTDNHLDRISALKSVVGGNYYHYRGGSYLWVFRGYKAANLAVSLKDFAPSRIEVITAFENWLNTDDREERLEIAGDFKASDNPYVDMDMYLPLVRLPQFTAGIVDARGEIYTVEQPPVGVENPTYWWVSQRLLVHSWNEALLEALASIYGGSVQTRVSRGRRSIWGSEWEGESIGHYWQLGSRNFGTLWEDIGSYVRLTSREN